MKKQFVCIPSELNAFTPIASKSEILYFYYSQKPLLRFYYYDAFIVCDDIISPLDLCIVDGPDYAYIEECERIDLESDRPVFYGTGDTRSLLCDAKKILATTNISLLSDTIRLIKEYELLPLLKEMNEKLQVPRFMMK